MERGLGESGGGDAEGDLLNSYSPRERHRGVGGAARGRKGGVAMAMFIFAMRGAVCAAVLVAVCGVLCMAADCGSVCMAADVEVVNGSSFGASGAVPVENVERPVKGSPEYLQLFLDETTWYNDIVLGWWLPLSVRDAMPHTLQTWLRNYVAGLLVYFSSGGLWCLYIYSWKADHFFPAGQSQLSAEGCVFLGLRVWELYFLWFGT